MVYKHIFFDLDRTLWDFDRNSRETLLELYKEQNVFNDLAVDFERFFQSFKDINAASWRDYRKGEQSKDELRNNRFVETYFKFGSGDWKKARMLSRLYLETCPSKPNLIEGAKEVLVQLSEKSKLHVITNGFSDTQKIKVEKSGLQEFLDQIIISEETKYIKPQKEIFEHAMRQSDANSAECLMVGDDYRSDVLGAMKAGWHQVYFNPEKKAISAEIPTYEIEKLEELIAITV